MRELITVETVLDAPIEKIWSYWTEPEHITHWAFASDDWHAPKATNDLRVGGTFTTRMEPRDKDGALASASADKYADIDPLGGVVPEPKDESQGFDFGGTYTTIDLYKRIEYKIWGGRTVKIEFIKQPDGYRIVQTFEAEYENPIEMQKNGWQAILNNFKKYVTEA